MDAEATFVTALPGNGDLLAHVSPDGTLWERVPVLSYLVFAYPMITPAGSDPEKYLCIYPATWERIYDDIDDFVIIHKRGRLEQYEGDSWASVAECETALMERAKRRRESIEKEKREEEKEK